MRLGFWGNFGTHNLGNECTLHSILASAQRYHADAQLVAIGNDPKDIEQRHKVEAQSISEVREASNLGVPRPVRKLWRLLRWETVDWIRVIRSAGRLDILFIAGTGIITDTYEGVFGTPYQMFKWVVATRLRGRKVKFVSVGAERLTNPIPLFFLRWSLRLANYRSYRDDLSRQRALDLGGAAADGAVYPDLAFSLPEALTHGRKVGPRDRTSVAVGIYAADAGSDETAAYIEAIGNFILWLLSHEFRVRVVIGDAAYDLAIKEQLRDWLAEKGALRQIADEPVTSFEGLLEQLAEADLVVATRFHNIQFSMMLEKPIVSISHMDKNDELMASMGLLGYCRALEGVNFEQILELFQKLQKDSVLIEQTIRSKKHEFRERLEEQYRHVFESTPQPRESQI